MEIIDVNSPKQTLRKVKIGQGVKIFNFVNAYECEIGDNSKVGAFVEITRGVKIGQNCKISSHTFICDGVTIGDGVFVGHNVTFINDLYPRAVNKDGSMQTDADWKLIETIVEDRATIGSGSTILCGITIGKNSMIGAGSLVSKNIPENALVAGNPAKLIRYLK